MTNPTRTATAPTTTSARKVAGASMIGTTIEYYDFFLYGTAAALVFNSQFFPTENPAVGTLAAFAAFAVGFLARPLGGVIFGHIGDRVGRKSTLIATLSIMGVASTLIGLLPTYASIGIWAPILLVLLRILQGIGLGGEGGGAVLMSVEHAPDGSKNRSPASPRWVPRPASSWPTSHSWSRSSRSGCPVSSTGRGEFLSC